MPAPQRVHGEIPELVPCSCLGTEEEKGGRKITTKHAEGSEGRGATPKSRPTTCLACVKTQHSPGEPNRLGAVRGTEFIPF